MSVRPTTNNNNPSPSINLHFIRAAIEANTGVRLSLEDTRQYLIEEGLITASQARRHAKIFRGYGEYFDSASPDAIPATPQQDVVRDLTAIVTQEFMLANFKDKPDEGD